MSHASVVPVVVSVVGLLLVAAVAGIGLKRLRLPYTIGLVVVGIVLGVLAERWNPLSALRVIELSPELILFVFLPTLIFESAFNLDSRLLARNLMPVLVLAAPGLVASMLVIGALLSWVTPLSLGAALLFGALISATDPVAVIALFKDIGAPKRLTILVEGESLFNDATAIVAFQLVLGALAGGMLSGGAVARGLLDFGIVFVGGFAVGAVIGYAMVRSIALADDDPLIEVALTTVVAYAAFIAADHYLHVSGVMAVVGAGAVVGSLGSTRFAPEVRAYLHRFWDYAAFVANSLIFLLVGMSVRPGTLTAGMGLIGWAILAALVARAVTVFGFVPLTGRLRGAEPIGRRYQVVLFWGGLRGAVALALALSLPGDFAARETIIALAVGVVLFTLLTGGLTMAPLIRWLGLDRPPLAERVARAQATLEAKREARTRAGRLRSAGHFSARLIDDLGRAAQRDVEVAERQLTTVRGACDAEELRRVLWAEALTVEQRAYRDQFAQGVISEPVLRELELAVDLQRDRLKQGGAPGALPHAVPLEVRIAARGMRLLEWVAPRSAPVRRHQLRALAARHELESAVVAASRRVVAEVAHLAELLHAPAAAVDEVREAYEGRAASSVKRLDGVAEHFPEFVQAVQRQTAQRILLDGEADAIARMAAAGAIPELVARAARREVERTVRMLARRPVHALEASPRELLARVPLFASLGDSDLERIAAALAARTVLAGTVVIRQGERGSSLFLVARGVVAVLVSRDGGMPERVASLHAGEFFGEMALLSAAPRSATVEAITDCQLYELSKRAIDEICATHPDTKRVLGAAAEARRVAIDHAST